MRGEPLYHGKRLRAVAVVRGGLGDDREWQDAAALRLFGGYVRRCALGHIPELEDGMGHLRAYARAVIIFQDLGQLGATYRKWESLIANASCQMMFGVNDETTAELVSRMLGDRTVAVRSMGINTGAGEASRRQLQPSEILRLGSDNALVFLRGAPHPILATRVRYYTEVMFYGLTDAWRAGTRTGVPLMLEHKPLRLKQSLLRIEAKPLRVEHRPVRITHTTEG